MLKIDINSKDIIDKKYKIVGCGTDGLVLRFNQEYLLKAYHNIFKLENTPELMTLPTKIYSKKIPMKAPNSSIVYYEHSLEPNEDIRLHSKDALKRAIEKQQHITKTKLPIGALYIDHKFAGSVIQRSKGIQIHKLTGLPLSLRRKIILDVLESFKELLDNYIYHLDLSNSPNGKSIYIDSSGNMHSVGHSHVLVNPFTLSTNIIDIDGKSAIYMERYNATYEKEAINGLTIMILEFFFQIDLDEIDIHDLDIMYLKNELSNLRIPDKFITKFEDDNLEYNDILSLVKEYH